MSGCLGLLFLLAAGQPQAGGAPVLAVAWLPSRGEVLVQPAGGGAIQVFDSLLQPKKGSTPVSMPTDAMMPSSDGTLTVPVWSRRTLQVDAATGALALNAAPWEREPVLRYGPGWICVELRSAYAGGELEWRRAGSKEVTALRFRGDRADALTQRVWLEGIDAGESLELRWAHPRPRFPRPSPAWVVVTMPAVDPAGERPTEAWP